MEFARGKFYLWNFKIWIRFTVLDTRLREVQ